MRVEDEAVDPALGAESGAPAIGAAAEAEGFAVWLRARKETAATGCASASPIGQTSWALFEWARNPYILVVWIYLFTPYFVNYVVGDGVRGQAIAGEIQTYSGLGIAILAPFLGAIADRGGRRKPWIALYTLIMIAAMLPMWFAMPHASSTGILYVGLMIAAANISYEFSAVFHNSLLPTIASPRRIAGLSGLGLSLGNAAGIIILLFMLIAFSLPGVVPWGFIPSHPLWGISQALHEPERLSGPVCAIWLLVFSMPLFFFTPDQPSSNLPLRQAMIGGVKSVIATIRSLKHYRNVGAYLLARLFFNDGMTAVLVFGGIYASTTFHWGPIQMLSYGIELSIFAVLGGFFGGWLDNKFGSKRAIFISIGGTTIAGLASLTMAPDRILWFIPYNVNAPHVWSLPFFNTWPEIIFLVIVNFVAVLITAGYANSRTMLARIAPPEKMAEFFGLYSLSGQSTSFLATGLVTWLTLISHNQRIGLLGETVFLVIGLILMFFVREERTEAIYMAHNTPPSGDIESVRVAAPTEALLADAAGPALFLKEHEISAEGGRAASRAGQFSWALFEGARDPNILFQIYIISPFFATVMMRDPIRGQELWGNITTWAGIITAVLAPFFGAVADKGGPRKPWLVLFSTLMVISFAGTWLGVADSSARIIFIVSALVVLNNVVFEFSNVFHGAMLPSIAPSSRMGGLSGLAFALGNGASLILLVFFLFAFMLPGQVDFLPKHPLFGVDQAAHVPERLSGPITAVWMLLAAIPLFLFTPDKAGSGLPVRQAIVEGIKSVIKTVRELKHYKNVAHYIGARSLFNDGMTGVLTFSGIYAAGTFHLGALQMTMYGIELCVFATLGGFFGGWLDNRLGSRKALLISIGGTALSFGLALTITPDHLFWFFPVSTAQVLPLPVFNTWSQIVYTGFVDVTALCIVGGYANNRTMMARIAPVEKMTEFFGLMSLSGTATTFFAPLLVSWMTYWTHSQRGGMVGVVVLLVAGWLWMFWVREERSVAV